MTRKQLNKLVKTKNDIAEYQQTLKDDLADVEKVKADLETKQADLDDVISQKNAEINKYSDDVEMQKALAAEYAKQESELDDKLAELARQEQQRLEEERKQREAEQQQQDNNGGSDNSGSDSDNSGSNNGGSTTRVQVSSYGLYQDLSQTTSDLESHRQQEQAPIIWV